MRLSALEADAVYEFAKRGKVILAEREATFGQRDTAMNMLLSAIMAMVRKEPVDESLHPTS